MSAFNDYCIVCDKICSTQSVYCSEDCRITDLSTHYEFENVPALISPALQPRCDSIATTLSCASANEETEDDEEFGHIEYMIRSPMLLTPTANEKIAGLSLDATPRSTDQSESEEAELSDNEDHCANLLATSSNNYKKWLQSHS